MSFVSNLRMRNMFPINSDLGSASIDLGGQDPMYEVIEAINAQRNSERMMNDRGNANGLQRVAGMRNPGTEMQEPLRFGGVVNQSNPGADILNRSKQSAERIYEGYKQPQVQAEQMGPSNDEINLKNYFGRKNAETTANANAGVLQDRQRIAQQNADSKGWKTVTVTDPNDPTKQINYRHNEVTGETKPIELPGLITRTGSAGDLQKQIDAKKQNELKRESQKTKATEALALMDELTDDKGNLKPDTQTATGYSANVPLLEKMPFGVGISAATGNAKINKLQGMLTLDLIKELKDQSKTGATGFGALNLRELGVLENSASMLASRNMDEVEFAKELGRIKERLQMILQDAPRNNSETGAPQNNDMSGRIKVRKNGKVGTVSTSAFNPAIHERVQ